MARKSVFEKYYAEVRESGRPLDEADFFEALSKTKFKGTDAWTFKVVFDTNAGTVVGRYSNVDDFIGFMFDKCTVGNNKIIHIFYDKESGLVSVFLAGRDD
jgi:hypothetical protein